MFRRTNLLLLLVLNSIYSQNIQISYPNTNIIENPQNITRAQDQINIANFINTNQTGIYGQPIVDKITKVSKNTTFNVRIKQGGYNSTNPWSSPLFTYNTYVDNTKSPFQNGIIEPNRENWENNVNSSFVNFSFIGSVTIEVTIVSNNSISEPFISNLNNCLVRPLSKGIVVQKVNNKTYFTLNEPGQYVLEFNGNRSNCLHVFANPIINCSFSSACLYNKPDSYYTHIYNNGIHYLDPLAMNNLNNFINKKIRLKPGAVLILPINTAFYSFGNGSLILKTGEEIFIEDGAILKGNIHLQDVNNVKIYGRGIIDLTDYDKNTAWRYSNRYKNNLTNLNTYAFLRGINIINSQNIIVDGIVINDSQQMGILINDSDYVSINNVKIFSRVIWGDGIHTTGSQNIDINNCFIRTTDDGISIYGSRHTPPNWLVSYQNRSALNYNVNNINFYSDAGKAIAIGWHGNYGYSFAQNPNPFPYFLNEGVEEGLDIYNLNFKNINILEHKQIWTDNLGQQNETYEGAIGIHCGDKNKCQTIMFENVNVEDFTWGKLLAIHIENTINDLVLTPGKHIENVTFKNFIYNGYGERASTIKGILNSCDRYVDGVHFNNFRVNNKLITNINDYVIQPSIPGLIKNHFAYNITFEEANRYITNLNTANTYKIQNVLTGRYLSKVGDVNNLFYIKTVSSSESNNDNSKWKISEAQTGHYYLKNLNDNSYLNNSNAIYMDSSNNYWPHYCSGRFLNLVNQTGSTRIEWKFENVGAGNYKIHNAHTRGFIMQDVYQNNVISHPEIIVSDNNQKWRLIPIQIFDYSTRIKDNSNEYITVYPNQSKGIFNVDLPTEITGELLIYDLIGKVVHREKLINNKKFSIDITNHNSGIYMLFITNYNDIRIMKKLIKN